MRAAAEATTWRIGLHPTRTLALGFAAACFGIFCLLPICYMLVHSFLGPGGDLSLHNYRQLLTEPRQRLLLLNSLLLGGGSSVLAAVIGTPLGVLLARVDIPAKRIVRLALLIPLVVPPYILALAWIYIGG